MTNNSIPKVLIPLVRRIMPSVIAHDITGVQPMIGPQGSVFSMRHVYGAPMKCDFCGKVSCPINSYVYPLHRNAYPMISNTERKEYFIVIFPETSIVESYYDGILISEYDYEFGETVDYFGIRDTDMDAPSVFRKNLSNLQYELNNHMFTKEAVAEHGVYFQ